MGDYAYSERDEDGFFEDDPDDFTLSNVTVLRDNPQHKAILVALDPDPRTFDGFECWIPRSQIRDHSPVRGGIDTGDLIISRWLAEQKQFC